MRNMLGLDWVTARRSPKLSSAVPNRPPTTGGGRIAALPTSANLPLAARSQRDTAPESLIVPPPPPPPPSPLLRELKSAAGAPTNSDGTINLVTYAAWLSRAPETTRGD